MSLSAGLSLSLLSNRLRGSPRDRLCGLRGWRSALRAAALVDVVLACQQPEFPCPEHIGRVRLQVFMMHWMWFGKSNSDPFTVQSWESASSLPLSWCSYSSWKRTASQLALYTSQGTLCFQPPALTLALLMSIHLMLVWLPVHLFCSHSAVHCTNCWEQWKSCLCFLNKLLLSRYLLTCLSFDSFLLHVRLWCLPPPFTAPLSFWSRVTACLLLPSLSQACPTSSPSEMSETGLLHSDCSTPSSLADTTAPQPSTDKVINTHPQWIL